MEPTFSFAYVEEGEHVSLRMYAGSNPDSRALAGQLVMRADEFKRFRKLMGPYATWRDRLGEREPLYPKLYDAIGEFCKFNDIQVTEHQKWEVLQTLHDELTKATVEGDSELVTVNGPKLQELLTLHVLSLGTTAATVETAS